MNNPVNDSSKPDGARGSGERLTDAEIICQWMEPEPTVKGSELDNAAMKSVFARSLLGEPCNASAAGWWRWVCLYEHGDIPELTTHPLDFDALWEVEERLIRLGFRGRIDNALSSEVWRDATAASTWHATPEQKIKTFAAVLRPIVEGAAVQFRELSHVKTNMNNPVNDPSKPDTARGSGERLTDAEIICQWMEPRPAKGPYDFRPWANVSPGGWWKTSPSRVGPPLVQFDKNEWVSRDLTLDVLWHVEARLILLGYRAQIGDALRWEVWRNAVSASVWHATPEQRVKALAVILRPIVEAVAIQSREHSRDSASGAQGVQK